MENISWTCPILFSVHSSDMQKYLCFEQQAQPLRLLLSFSKERSFVMKGGSIKAMTTQALAAQSVLAVSF